MFHLIHQFDSVGQRRPACDVSLSTVRRGKGLAWGQAMYVVCLWVWFVSTVRLLLICIHPRLPLYRLQLYWLYWSATVAFWSPQVSNPYPQHILVHSIKH